MSAVPYVRASSTSIHFSIRTSTATIALLAIALASAVPAVASATPSPSPVPSASPSPGLETIVVTSAQRRDTPLAQAIKPTYVVDRQTIERFGYDTIAEAIRNVPGERSLTYGAFGARAGYGSGGAIGNATLVLLNGVPIAEGSDGEVDLGSLSSNGVERIEVVESGGSTVYGSGATGGIINIVTVVPHESSLEAAYGSFGDREVRVRAGNGIVGATFERHIATNDYAYGPLDGFSGGVRDNDQALQTDASIEYGQKLGGFDVRATGRFTKLDLHVPGQLGGLTPSEFEATNRNDLVLDVSRTSGRQTTSLALSGLKQDGEFFSFGELYDARTNLSLKETIGEGRRSALVAGIDLSRESALDDLGSFGPPSAFASAQSQAAVYAQQAVGIGPGGNAYAGLRAEHDSPAGSILAPGAGVLFPVGKLLAGGNVGSSFVVPTLYDLDYPGSSNPALLPERDRSIDVELSAPHVVAAPTLELFDRNARDLITFNSKFIPYNAGFGHFQGATLNVAAKAGGRVGLTASVTDLWTATQVTDGVAQRADYEPTMSGTLQIERSMGGRDGLALGAVAHLNGGHTESGSGPGVFGGYTTADAYATVRANPHAFVTLRIRNLGNDRFGSYDAYPEPGRSYRLEFATR